ncbi:MAG: nucleoside-diphosphate kinase [Mobiluncus sp.]|uniref:Nucleoside diphosphate kinase n=1 Tax=Mobiluncus porci TaxID=2652278 RepID=A0A7K0K436_9ACTO|nr:MULTISPECIES: nucleoside-diphosphate kinase [Mobiluncus]MCI6583656.1 nucleoside-diphosphate kinase [Mobiluncus sp.]MST50236.1 nucleoside-diphosphate kinase [Mobiluncus porci]
MADSNIPYNPKEEHTLVLIKPDGYARGLIGEVISRIEKRGFKIIGLKITIPTQEELEEHYFEHKDKHFFNSLCEYMSSGPIVAMVVEGSRVVQSFRNMMGDTNPALALPGTIRGDLARDWGPDRGVENIVHGSDSPQSADREIALWFPEMVD